jgi:hypothetical protein
VRRYNGAPAKGPPAAKAEINFASLTRPSKARSSTASEIDLLVAYIVPVDAWYVFPVEEFRKYKTMKLFPASRRRGSKFEKVRENWGVVS